MRAMTVTTRQRISTVFGITVLTVLTALPAWAFPFEGRGGSTTGSASEPLVRTVTTGVSLEIVVAIVAGTLLAAGAAYVAGISHERRVALRHT